MYMNTNASRKDMNLIDKSLFLTKRSANELFSRDENSEDDMSPVAVYLMIVSVAIAIYLLGLITAGAILKKKRKKETNVNTREESTADGVSIYDGVTNNDTDNRSFVPQYSAYPDINNDLGYYDQRGEFHFNERFSPMFTCKSSLNDCMNACNNEISATNESLYSNDSNLVSPFQALDTTEVLETNISNSSYFDTQTQLNSNQRLLKQENIKLSFISFPRKAITKTKVFNYK